MNGWEIYQKISINTLSYRGRSKYGHGEDKNTAVQLASHAILGVALAYVNGGNLAAGGSAAVASEAAATYFTKQLEEKYKDDPKYYANGEFQPNLLSEAEKSQIRDLTAAIGAVVGGTVGDSAFEAQLAGVVGQNAVENNYLSKKQVNEFTAKLSALNNGIKACRDRACVEEINKERNKLLEEYKAISKKQDIELKNLCFSQPKSSACSSDLKEALFYNGSTNAQQIQITRNSMKDRNLSSENTLSIIYNSPNAKNLINKRVESVDDRANFFSTNGLCCTNLSVKAF